MLNSEYVNKEEILVRFIMENGGQELDQRMSNLNINGSKDFSQVKDIITKSLSMKEEDDQ